MTSAQPDNSGSDEFSSLDFWWNVGTAGHDWLRPPVDQPPPMFHTHHVDGPNWVDLTGDVLYPNIGDGGHFKYEPLAVPELFQIFADTPCTPDGIRDFADQYGLLWMRPLHQRLALPGDTIGEWTREILEMRTLIGIRDALENNTGNVLRKWVMRPGEGREELAPLLRSKAPNEIPPDEGWVFVLRDHEGRPVHYTWDAWHPADGPFHAPETRDKPARRYMIQRTNTRLREHCSPILHFRSERNQSLIVRVVPKNLAGALWWQFARTATGEARYNPCEVCGKMIEWSANEGHRTNKKFCSPACKYKAHRQRVKQARDASAEGKTIRQIAKLMDADEVNVRRWIGKK